MTLDGKTVLVTGAALGFGYGIARALGRAGAKVCATDVHEAHLARVAADLTADGADVLSMILDAGDLKAFHAAVGRLVDRWGRLDAIVHAGIIMPLQLWEDSSEESWWRELQVSLGGIMNAARAGWETMKRQGGGHVIGIASGSSFRGYKREVIYCTGKHAVEGFVKALALEASPHRISLNAMGPGKRIKPTGITWDELQRTPLPVRDQWTDPVELGGAFVWLVGQPPGRYSGLRFDAGPIIDTIGREGWSFRFAPEKVTLYPDDMKARLEWSADYDRLSAS